MRKPFCIILLFGYRLVAVSFQIFLKGIETFGADNMLDTASVFSGCFLVYADGFQNT